jgi:hypothetical protein
MTLIKTSLLSGIALIIKMLALYRGSIQNTVQMITAFASGDVNTGVARYTAEYYNHEPRLGLDFPQFSGGSPGARRVLLSSLVQLKPMINSH